jgi:hypothetical protein
MFGIGIHIEMEGSFDIDLHEVDIECPRCHFSNPIWIRQARLRDTIICRGCKSNIRLDDGMNTVRKARNQFLRQMKEIQSQIDKFNRQCR